VSSAAPLHGGVPASDEDKPEDFKSKTGGDKRDSLYERSEHGQCGERYEPA
jgi:hypothetical protein